MQITADTEAFEEEPEALLCPITYSIFRDPVLCEGRTFECDGIVGFWRRRPLADFFGGPQLQRAQLRPDMEMRARVQDWLKQNPQTVPSGWETRDPGHQSTQEDCDRLSSEINLAAAARAAADAAEGGGGQAVAVAVRFLREFAPVVRLCGRTPGGKRREFLGVYDRCDDCPLIAGRYAYLQRGSEHLGHEARMLWYAPNGFWHAGWAANLGQQTGWLIVSDAAVAPELIVGEWQLWDAGKLWQVPRVKVKARAEGDAGGAEGMDASSGADSDDEAEKAAYQAAEAAEAAAEEMRRAHAEAVLDTASHVVHLDAEHPEQWGSRMHAYRSWMGTYEVERVDDSTLPLRVNGRYAYTHQSSRERMLWWSAGYWHLGLRRHLGAQTALLISGDSALLPEHIAEPWMIFERGAWATTPSQVRCKEGAAGERCGPSNQSLGGVVIGAWAYLVICLSMQICSMQASTSIFLPSLIPTWAQQLLLFMALALIGLPLALTGLRTSL